MRFSLHSALLVAAASLTFPVLSAPVAQGTSGSFTALTLNVAGLPAVISSGHPAQNTADMGKRISNFDIVNVQEDFNYHATLYANDNHPFRTPTSGGVPFGSGLNTVSKFSFTDFTRIKWNTCSEASGSDCLTPKGFTVMRVRLDEGAIIDMYNLHTDAGTEPQDETARSSNLFQVADYIAANSVGNAVWVMGDTNSRYTRANDSIAEFAAKAGLTDAWVELVRNGVAPTKGAPPIMCASPPTNDCEVVDKFLYRSGPLLSLSVANYRDQNAAFLDAAGNPLSDHFPLSVDVSYAANAQLRASDAWGGQQGTAFSMAGLAGTGSVRSVTLRGAARLDAVSIVTGYGGNQDGPTFAYGGTGGTATSLELAADEHLSAVTLTRGSKDGGTRVFSATFTTSKGKTVAAGTPTSDAVTYAAPAGWQIVGV